MIPADGGTARPVLDSYKLRESLLFFVCEGGIDLGKTKLMKLLYYSDFGFFAQHDRAITNAVYRKYPRGPVAVDAVRMLQTLAHEGRLNPVQVFTGPYLQQSFEVVGNYELPSSLDERELSHLRTVWNRWETASTTAIVSASHEEFPWRSVSLYEEIPYHTAYFL